MPLLWLDDVTERDRARVGAKAFALARLRRASLPVPNGFVVPGDDPEPGPEVLEEPCRRLGAVAVRSSALEEDSAEASFAGQFRTELDVRGAAEVAAAVRRCRQASAAGYALAMGARADAAARTIPVLVQAFVEPRQAGVVFTRDPRDPAAMVVESHAGRGEALVSGRVRPARVVVDRETGAARPSRDPEAPAAGGLDPDERRAVASLAREAEALFGEAQDVEWAIGSGAGQAPVLLQSRPITVESEEALDPRIGTLTRANVGEVLPDPVTPLTASTVVALLEHGFEEVVRLAGLGHGGGAPFLVVHRERLYLNLTRSLEVAARLPGVSAADAERLVLGAGASGATPHLRPVDLPRLAFVAARVALLGARLPGRIAQAEDDVRRLQSLAADAERSPAALATAFDTLQALGGEVATTHIAVSGASAVRLALLERALGWWLPGDPRARLNRLLAGLDGVESAAPALALDTLARRVRSHSGWRAFVARPDAAEAFARDEAPPDLAALLRAFLHRFGHRAVSEGELRARPWRDDPAPVLQALATLGASPRAPGFTQAAAAAQRQAEEQAALSRLGPVRRALLRTVLRAARDGVRSREATKSLAVALVDAGRRLARAAGRRLAASGALDDPDDVFFLSAAEVQGALGGVAPSPAARRRRRRRFERAVGVPAPRLVDLRGGATGEEEPPGWSGTGVSPGIGVGPARVVGEGEAVRLEPGEVLVAPVLDAAMGPALSAAAGAVAEIGGLLSHGAVVARELGVPCVVDVRDATRRLRTGQRLLVDGTAGVVRLLEANDIGTGTGAANPGADGPALLDTLPPASPADEAFHVLEAHPLARESIYVNAQDPASGCVLVASVGARPGGRGEALLALGRPDGRVLFALEMGRLERRAAAVGVGGFEAGWSPVHLRFDGRLSVHESDGFPPGPLPLLLAPRVAPVAFDLVFTPTTPAIDFTAGLSPDERARLRPVGAHHVEQSGRWQGTMEIDGRRARFDGTGSRDHSWGRRDWNAAEWWRLFTARFGDDLAVHALALDVDGQVVEGGFVWREGRAEAVRRVAWTDLSGPAGGRRFELELATTRGAVRLAGAVTRTLTVPVQLARSPARLLAGRPWRLALHENYTRYSCQGRTGHGIAEFTERP
jgi:phosphohistidine swiveling domain-containing protein